MTLGEKLFWGFGWIVVAVSIVLLIHLIVLFVRLL